MTEFTQPELRRLRAVVGERVRKIQKGLDKFEKDFDPVLGAGLLQRHKDYSALERKINAAIAQENDHPRRTGRNQEEPNARD